MRALMAVAFASLAVFGFLSADHVGRAVPDFCARKPSHPKCRTTSSTAPTTAPTVTVTSSPPPTTTAPPPSTGEQRANVWISP